MGRGLFLLPSFAVLLLISMSPALAAQTDLLTFRGITDMQPLGDFYNGGGPPGVPNFGVSFSTNFYGLRSECAAGSTVGNCMPGGPGSGAFLPHFSNPNAIFILGSTGVNATGYFNVSAGFSTGINLFYTAAFNETITVWSGAGGTGTVLATLALSPNDVACSTGPAYCNWTSVGLAFSGTAQSVTFSGPANGIGINDITLGSDVTAIPSGHQHCTGCAFRVFNLR